MPRGMKKSTTKKRTAGKIAKSPKRGRMKMDERMAWGATTKRTSVKRKRRTRK